MGKLHKTTKQFIREVKALDRKRGDNYDYSKYTYRGVMKKSTVICKEHGKFLINANNRLNGQGCPTCGKIKNVKPVGLRETAFKKKVDSRYDLSEFVFTNYHNKSTVICPTHGRFQMAPKHLTRGHGCKSCGYSLSNHKKSDWIKRADKRAGIFYIIRCFKGKESFYKLGITCVGIKERYRKPENMPYSYEIVKEIISHDLEFIWNLESKLKQHIKVRNIPKISFNGCVTECFTNLKEIMNYLKKV